VNPGLASYLAAPESIRDEFDRKLSARAEAETGFRRYLGELQDDDPTPPRQPETPLARTELRWDFRWIRRARRRREHPEANSYDRDRLMELDLRELWPQLTGVEVPATGLAPCPSPDHEDRHPSCSVRDQRWRCFACGTTGTVIDLAAIVFEIPPTGRGFFEIRERLLEAA
jgi:hypothetical protein